MPILHIFARETPGVQIPKHSLWDTSLVVAKLLHNGGDFRVCTAYEEVDITPQYWQEIQPEHGVKYILRMGAKAASGVIHISSQNNELVTGTFEDGKPVVKLLDTINIPQDQESFVIARQFLGQRPLVDGVVWNATSAVLS